MKNIHILPTDKPSRLSILNSGKLDFGAEIMSSSNSKPQHIYITSNEEIKEGDWYYYFGHIINYECDEHTLTPNCKKIILTTDQDLIKEQIKIAAGEKISGKNYEPQLHAIECRINAEDPYNDFRPSPGKITVLHTPGGHGVRVDSHVYAGYVIPPYYDSMIGKLITVAQTREEAINTMYRALSEYVIEGVKTTIPFHLQLMQNEDFRKGNFTTKFLETFTMK